MAIFQVKNILETADQSESLYRVNLCVAKMCVTHIKLHYTGSKFMDLHPEEFLCRSQIIILRKTCATETTESSSLPTLPSKSRQDNLQISRMI